MNKIVEMQEIYNIMKYTHTIHNRRNFYHGKPLWEKLNRKVRFLCSIFFGMEICNNKGRGTLSGVT